MGRVSKIAIIIVALVFAVSISKDMIVKAAVEKGVEVVTGLKLNVKSFKVGILKTLIDIRQLTLFNPENFKDRIMVDIPEIYVDYHLQDILKGRIHLEEVSLHLREFHVIKNEKGQLNLDALKVVQAQKKGKKPRQIKGDEEGARVPKIQIDRLKLKIGKVVYKDYSRGASPQIQEFNVNLSEEYTDIDDPYKLVSLIVTKTLVNTAISRLTNFDIGGLESTISDTLTAAENMLGKLPAGDGAAQVVRETRQVASGTAKKTTEALGSLTKNLKLPFGGEK